MSRSTYLNVNSVLIHLLLHVIHLQMQIPLRSVTFIVPGIGFRKSCLLLYYPAHCWPSSTDNLTGLGPCPPPWAPKTINTRQSQRATPFTHLSGTATGVGTTGVSPLLLLLRCLYLFLILTLLLLVLLLTSRSTIRLNCRQYFH